MYLNIINQFTDYKLKSNLNITYFKVFILFALRNENIHHCQFLWQFSAHSTNLKSLLTCKKRIILCVFTAHRFKRVTMFTVFRNPNVCYSLIRSLTSCFMICWVAFQSICFIIFLQVTTTVVKRWQVSNTQHDLNMDQYPGRLIKIYCRTISHFFDNVWGIQFHSIENW